MTSKAKKLVKSSLVGQLSFVLRIFVTLFMTPFMISSLGDHSYGLWILVASFSGFYGLLDMGLATAVQRYLSRALGANDYKEANTIFNTSLIVFSLIGVVSLVLVFGISAFAHVFVKNAADILLFKKTIILLGIGLAFSFPMRSFWAIFPCHLRWDINIYLDLLTIAIKTILIVIFLKKGYGIWALAIINFLADSTNYLLNAYFSLKIAPYIRISTKYFNKSRIRQFLRYSIFSFISKIANMLKGGIDNFVIAAFVGVSSITVYTIARRLLGYFWQTVSKSVGLMMPIFSRYEAANDYDSIRRHFLFVTKISGVISMMIGSMLIIFGKAFITLWVGSNYVEAYTLLLIFVIPATIGLIQLPSSQLLYGISKHKFLSIANSIEAVCNLALSLILVRFLGLKGVALGTVIPATVSGLCVLPFYVCRVINIKSSAYFLKTLMPVVFKSTLLAFPMWILAQNITINSYFSLIGYGCGYVICYLPIMFLICFSKEEQDTILNAMPDKISGILKKGHFYLRKTNRQ